MNKRNNEFKLEGGEHKHSKEMDELIEFASETVRKSLHQIVGKANDLRLPVYTASRELYKIYLAMALAIKEGSQSFKEKEL